MKVLILGVASVQMDAVEQLKEMGCETYTCAMAKDGPAADVSDHFELINILDESKLLAYIKNNHIDIITFTGNEKSKISQYATLPIIIGHYNPFYHDNLVPNAFFGQVLIIFESLLYSFLSSKK